MITGKFKNQDIPLKQEDGWRVHVDHRYHDGSFDQFYLSYVSPEVPREYRAASRIFIPNAFEDWFTSIEEMLDCIVTMKLKGEL